MLNILSHFPSKDHPRPQQTKVLNEIQQAIINKKKFIIVQAPTGAGKSHIAATIASSSSSPNSQYIDLVDSYKISKMDPINGWIYEDEVLAFDPFGCAVLTVSKSLQDQYKELFDNASILKGKQNYICKVDENFDCDFAPCTLTPKIMDDCKKTHKCPMLNARREVWKSKFGVFNYSVFLNQPEFLKRRQYFICDEASELEDELVKHFSCEVDYSKIKLSDLNLLKLQSNINGDSHRWITDLSTALKEKIDQLNSTLQKSKKNQKMFKSQIGKMRLYKNLYEKTITVLQNWYKAEYITELTKDSATFTPLYVNILAQDFFKWGETVILMSGTIIDHQTFAQTLGINKDDYVYIEADCDFDPQKSPIYCDVKTKLNYKNMDKMLPDLVNKAIKICDHFKNSKGVIHTHSFKITEALLNKVKKDKRFLVRGEGTTNESLLNEHYIRDDGTVLISPSLGFGTDLKDDFGRFSIIIKTPYLPLGSERIKRLANKNQQWYEMKALVNLVQMCGRTTRNKDDHSETFILDGSAIDLIKRNKSKIPDWFLKRIH